MASSEEIDLGQLSGDFPNDLSHYLLVAVGEPLSEDFIDLGIAEIEKGLKRWDIDAAATEFNEVLQGIAASEVIKAGLVHRGLAHCNSHVGIVVLINPHTTTLVTQLRSLLLHPAPHKHLAYGGHVLEGSGDWVFHNDTFSLQDIADIFSEPEVDGILLQVQANQENKQTLSVSGCHWTTAAITKQAFAKTLNLAINPQNIKNEIDGISELISTIQANVVCPSSFELLEPPTMGVGVKCKITKPTVLIFPAAKGDCAFFAVSDFSIFVGGGYSVKSCFWKFAKHLHRIDAILMPHLNPDTVVGINSLLKRKIAETRFEEPEHDTPEYEEWQVKCNSPEVGVVYLNAPANKTSPKTLTLKTVSQGNCMQQLLHDLDIKPFPCAANAGKLIEPITLYQKVGIGRLDMFILTPVQDSKELKDFLLQWSNGKQFGKIKTGMKVNGKEAELSLPNAVSICSLIVWQPANQNEDIVRVLFPGNAPQSKILEGLDRIKHLNFLKQRDVTQAKLTKGNGKKGKSSPKSGAAKIKTSSTLNGSSATNSAEQVPCTDGIHCNTPPPFEVTCSAGSAKANACINDFYSNTPRQTSSSATDRNGNSFRPIPSGTCSVGITCYSPPPFSGSECGSDGVPEITCSAIVQSYSPPPDDTSGYWNDTHYHFSSPPPLQTTFRRGGPCGWTTPPPEEEGGCTDFNTPPPEEEPANDISPIDNQLHATVQGEVFSGEIESGLPESQQLPAINGTSNPMMKPVGNLGVRDRLTSGEITPSDQVEYGDEFDHHDQTETFGACGGGDAVPAESNDNFNKNTQPICEERQMTTNGDSSPEILGEAAPSVDETPSSNGQSHPWEPQIELSDPEQLHQEDLDHDQPLPESEMEPPPEKIRRMEEEAADESDDVQIEIAEGTPEKQHSAVHPESQVFDATRQYDAEEEEEDTSEASQASQIEIKPHAHESKSALEEDHKELDTDKDGQLLTETVEEPVQSMDSNEEPEAEQVSVPQEEPTFIAESVKVGELTHDEPEFADEEQVQEYQAISSGAEEQQEHEDTQKVDSELHQAVEGHDMTAEEEPDSDKYIDIVTEQEQKEMVESPEAEAVQSEIMGSKVGESLFVEEEEQIVESQYKPADDDQDEISTDEPEAIQAYEKEESQLMEPETCKEQENYQSKDVYSVETESELNKDEDIEEVGDDLEAEHVIEGHVTSQEVQQNLSSELEEPEEEEEENMSIKELNEPEHGTSPELEEHVHAAISGHVEQDQVESPVQEQDQFIEPKTEEQEHAASPEPESVASDEIIQEQVIGSEAEKHLASCQREYETSSEPEEQEQVENQKLDAEAEHMASLEPEEQELVTSQEIAQHHELIEHHEEWEEKQVISLDLQEEEQISSPEPEEHEQLARLEPEHQQPVTSLDDQERVSSPEPEEVQVQSAETEEEVESPAPLEFEQVTCPESDNAVAITEPEEVQQIGKTETQEEIPSPELEEHATLTSLEQEEQQMSSPEPEKLEQLASLSPEEQEQVNSLEQEEQEQLTSSTSSESEEGQQVPIAEADDVVATAELEQAQQVPTTEAVEEIIASPDLLEPEQVLSPESEDTVATLKPQEIQQDSIAEVEREEIISPEDLDPEKNTSPETLDSEEVPILEPLEPEEVACPEPDGVVDSPELEEIQQVPNSEEEIASPEHLDPAEMMSPEPLEPEQVTSPEPLESEQVSSPEPDNAVASPEPEEMHQVSSAEEITNSEPLEPEQVTSPEPLEPEQVMSPEPLEPEQVMSSEPLEPKQVMSPEPLEPEQVMSPEHLEPEQVTSPEPLEPEQVTSPEPLEHEQETSPELLELEQVMSPELLEPEQVTSPEPFEPEQVTSPEPFEPEQVMSPEPFESEQVMSPEPLEPEQVMSPGPLEPEQVMSPEPLEPGQVMSPEPSDPVASPEPTSEPLSEKIWEQTLESGQHLVEPDTVKEEEIAVEVGSELKSEPIASAAETKPNEVQQATPEPVAPTPAMAPIKMKAKVTRSPPKSPGKEAKETTKTKKGKGKDEKPKGTRNGSVRATVKPSEAKISRTSAPKTRTSAPATKKSTEKKTEVKTLRKAPNGDKPTTDRKIPDRKPLTDRKNTTEKKPEKKTTTKVTDIKEKKTERKAPSPKGRTASGDRTTKKPSKSTAAKTETQRPTSTTKSTGNSKKPTEMTKKTSERTSRGAPLKPDSKKTDAKRVSSTKSSSVGNKPSIIPVSGPAVYVDLTYIPNHASAENVNMEFFRRIRAKHYVMSGNNKGRDHPSMTIMDALLQGKQKWEDMDAEVNVIPTYDIDALHEWERNKQDELSKANITIAQPACRSIVQMKDENFFMYKVEF